MGEYFAKMPFQGIPRREAQPVCVTTYEPQPPRCGWTAHIQSISTPTFILEVGYDQLFTEEALLLQELTLFCGLSKD